MKPIYKSILGVTFIIGMSGYLFGFGGSDPTDVGHDVGELELSPLEIDVPNSRVGIGTTSPAADLEVKNSDTSIIRISSDTHITTGDEIGALEFFEFHTSVFDSLGLPAVVGKISSVVEGDVGSKAGLAFSTFRNTTQTTGALSEIMRISFSGNVGIGTTDPRQRLHVDGGDVRWSRGAVFGQLQTVSDAVHIGSGSVTRVRFDIGSSTKMTLQTNGKLTINTLSGTGTRHVCAEPNGSLVICP